MTQSRMRHNPEYNILPNICRPLPKTSGRLPLPNTHAALYLTHVAYCLTHAAHYLTQSVQDKQMTQSNFLIVRITLFMTWIGWQAGTATPPPHKHTAMSWPQASGSRPQGSSVCSSSAAQSGDNEICVWTPPPHRRDELVTLPHTHTHTAMSWPQASGL